MGLGAWLGNLRLVTILVTILGAGIAAADIPKSLTEFHEQVAAIATGTQALIKEIDPPLTAAEKRLLGEGKPLQRSGLSAERKAQLLATLLMYQDRIANELDPAVKPLISQFVKGLKSPSLDYLQEVHDQIEADLATLYDTADEADSDLKEDGLQFLKTSVTSRVRAQLQQKAITGNPRPAIEFFQFISAYISLTRRYLELVHYEAVLAGQNSISWGRYLEFYQSFQATLLFAHSYYPALPDFSAAGDLASYDIRSGRFGADLGRLHAEKVNLAYKIFTATIIGAGFPNSAEGSELQTKYRAAMDDIRDSHKAFELYRQLFFPKYGAKALLTQFLSSVSEVGGAIQCFQLADRASHSRSDGAVCQISDFYHRLNRFTNYYEKVREPTLLLSLMEIVAAYRKKEYDWARVRKEVRNIEPTDLAPDLREQWRRMQQALLTGQQEVEFKKMCDKVSLDGVVVWHVLKQWLEQGGLGLRPGMTGMVMAGTVQDFTPDVESVQRLQKALINNVIAPLEGSKLDQTAEVKALYQKKVAELKQEYPAPSAAQLTEAKHEALIEELQNRMTVLDAQGAGWCPLLTDKTLTDEAKRLKSPWVVSYQRYLDPQGGRSRPKATNSANGFQRLDYLSTAKVVNLVAGQNTYLPEKMFAGIAVRTAISTILPNAVQARMMLQGILGAYDGKDLGSLGVKVEAERGVMRVSEVHNFRGYEEIIEDSKTAWNQGLAHYAGRHAQRLLRITPQEVEGLSHEEQAELAHKRFLQNYDEITRDFIQSYRRDMYAAVKMARKFDEARAKLRYGVDGAPTWGQELAGGGPDPFAGFLPQQNIPGQYGPRPDPSVKRLFETNAHQWILMFRKTAALRKRYGDHQDEKIWEIAQSYNGSAPDITAEEFKNEFWKFGRRMGVGKYEHDLLLGFRNDGLGDGAGPAVLAAMYHTVLNTYVKQEEALLRARNLVLFRFPALHLKSDKVDNRDLSMLDPTNLARLKKKVDDSGKPKLSDELYKTYQNTDEEFRRVLMYYLDNAVAELNEYQGLGANTWFSWAKDFVTMGDEELGQARRILDKVLPNRPLVDIIVRNFPDQMLFICQQTAARQAWDEGYQTFLTGMAATGSVIALVGLIPGCQGAGIVGLGMAGLAAYLQKRVVNQKQAEHDSAEAFALAAGPQLSPEADTANWDYLREMQKEIDAAQFLANVDIAFTAIAAVGTVASASWRIASVVRQAPGMGRLMKAAASVFQQEMRVLPAIGRGAGRFAGRMKQWKFWAVEENAFRARFASWFKNVNGPGRFNQEMWLLDRSGRAVLFAADEFNNFFLRLAGLKWANTWRGMLAPITLDAYLGVSYFRNYLAENEANVLMGLLYEHPEENREMLDAVDRGLMSHGELLLCMEATPRFRARYLQPAEQADFRLNADELLQKLSPEEIAEAKENIRHQFESLQAEMAKMNPYSGEYFAAKKNFIAIELLMRRWEILGK